MSKQQTQTNCQGTVMLEDVPTFTHRNFEAVHREYSRLCKVSRKYAWITFDDNIWDNIKEK